MSAHTSPVHSPSHSHEPRFHFDPDENSTPTGVVLVTAVEVQAQQRVVGTSASLGDAVAAREGIATAPPALKLPEAASEEGRSPRPDQPLTIATPTHEKEIFTTEELGAEAISRTVSQSSTASVTSTSPRRFCGCLEGWLPSCIIDFFEWICCCICCYNEDDTGLFTPITPLSKLPASRFRSTDETEMKIFGQIEFAIRERAGHLVQGAPSQTFKVIALLNTFKDGEKNPFFTCSPDIYQAATFSADALCSKLTLTGEGAKMRNFEFALIIIDDQSNAEIHIYTYADKQELPHHAPVIKCASTEADKLASAQRDYKVLQHFNEDDFNLLIRSPMAKSPSPTLEAAITGGKEPA